MKVLPQGEDNWGLASFRMAIEGAWVFVTFFLFVRCAEDTEDAYISGLWGILRGYEEAGRVLILCLAVVLVQWSAALLVPSSGRRARGYGHALSGLLVASLCIAVYLLGLTAKPR